MQRGCAQSTQITHIGDKIIQSIRTSELFNNRVLFSVRNRGEGSIFMLGGWKGIRKWSFFEINRL
jgi:hypothetical protein